MDLRFSDRAEAGQKLAARLAYLRGQHPIVLALPRGGVPIGFEIARALAAPLDLVLVRKIGAPYQPEFAIGAVADGEAPELVTDPRLIRHLQVTDDYLAEAEAAALRELERRRDAYLRGRAPVDLSGGTAIVVDDGIATGATMLAALRSTRRRGPARLVLAVPVAAADAVARLRPEVDDCVVLGAPSDFYAVGQFYDAFPQLCDEEVIALLDQAQAFAPKEPPP